MVLQACSGEVSSETVSQFKGQYKELPAQCRTESVPATSPALIVVLCHPFARKRDTQKFCLTPRLSLQLYYIPVMAPKVAKGGSGGRYPGTGRSR